MSVFLLYEDLHSTNIILGLELFYRVIELHQFCFTEDLQISVTIFIVDMMI